MKNENFRAARRAFHAVREYTRADGTTVRGHIKSGAPAIHDIHGRGFINPDDVNSGARFVRFTVGNGVHRGRTFRVGRTALTSL